MQKKRKIMRRKGLSLLLSAALMASMLPMGSIQEAEAADSGTPEVSADAEGGQEITASGTFGGEKDSEGVTVTEDTHQWSFAAGTGVLTISGEGAIPDYTSSTCTGLPWYEYADDIKKIVFTGNVTKVGNYMFYNYTKVEEVDFGAAENLTEIGEYSFNKTTLLGTLAGTDHLVSLGANCFNASGLKTVTMPQVASVPEAAFKSCSSLTAIHFPVATIFGKQAFNSCKALTEVDAPKVTELAESVFNTCSGLEAIELPELQTISAGSAFYGCSKLKSVSLPKLGTMNGSSAFQNCTSLETLNLPSVTSVTKAYRMVMGCTSLTSVNIPNAVFKDDSQIFQDCSSLVYVDISSVQTLSSITVFKNCTSLKRIYLKGTGLTSKLAANFYDSLTATPDIYYLSEAATNVNIGSYANGQAMDSESDYNAARAKETSLHVEQENYDIETPAEPKVTGNASGAEVTYGYYTDVACQNPVDSSNPANKPTVAGDYFVRATAAATDSTFETTSNPASFRIYGEIPGEGFTYHNGTGIPTITDASVMATDFTKASAVPWYQYRNELKKAVVKEGVTLTKIPAYAFSGMKYMEEFALPDTVTEIGASAFSSCSKWKAENVLTDKVTSVGASAFNGCSLISGTMTFGSSITEIPDMVLYGCAMVNKIVYSDSVTSFGDRCFVNTGVTEPYPLPSGMTEYPEYFYSGIKITSFAIPEGMTKVPNRLFESTASLTEITIPDSVTEIGNFAFSGTGLTSLSLPKNIQTIGRKAFGNTKKLETVEIPETLTALPQEMFNGSGLRKVIVPGTVATIDTSVFRDCQQLEYLEFENDNYTEETFKAASASSGGIKYDQTFAAVPKTAMIVCDGTTYELLASRGTYKENASNGWLAEEILYKRSTLLSDLENTFNDAKAEAGTLKESDYDSELWSGFQTALAEAEALFSQGETTYDQIQNRMAATKSIPAAAKAFLCATYQKTEGILETDYDTEGDGADAWFLYLDERDMAMDVLRNGDATLAQVIEADKNLRQAMKNIVLLPVDGAKTDFESYIQNEIGALKEADYTAESWKVLQDAIAEAKKLSQDATKVSEVEAAKKKVEDAVAALVKGDVVSPSTVPEASPSVKPSESASAKPSASPSAKPSASPSAKPSPSPSVKPSQNPSVQPTKNPGGTVAPKKISVKKVTLKKVTSKKKKTILVQWKKVSGVTGYQIQIGTNKKVTKGKKTYTVKKAKTVKKTIKKLKRKKKYYVRVGAYKTSGGKKYYGKWSKVKKVKVK